MWKKEKPQVDLEMFTIYDTKVGSYDVPTFAVNGHDLCRQIINMFTDPAQARNKYLVNAEDYTIFKVGEYSKTTGAITPVQHESVALMHELREAALKRDPRLVKAEGPDRALSLT